MINPNDSEIRTSRVKTFQSRGGTGLIHCRNQRLNLRQWKFVLFICDWLDRGDRQRPREAIVVLARYREAHVCHVDGRLLSIVPVDSGILNGLGDVIVHKLDKLIRHILFVILDSCAMIVSQIWLRVDLPCFSMSLSIS